MPPLMGPSQPPLFGRIDEVAPDPSALLHRLELSHGAWVDHSSGWLLGHQRLFEHFAEHASWRSHQRPMYDRIVDVPRLMGGVPDDAWSGAIFELIQAFLAVTYGMAFDRIGLALYRDGRDSVAWHGDQVARELPQAFVATVSLGEPRTFGLRPKQGGERHNFRLGHGDLVVMGGTCQRTWEHCVPKVARAGPRMALMFRPTETSIRPG